MQRLQEALLSLSHNFTVMILYAQRLRLFVLTVILLLLFLKPALTIVVFLTYIHVILFLLIELESLPLTEA